MRGAALAIKPVPGASAALHSQCPEGCPVEVVHTIGRPTCMFVGGGCVGRPFRPEDMKQKLKQQP